MTDHELTANITGGTVTATTTYMDEEDRLDYELQSFEFGQWTCSCGAGPFSESGAAEHLREARSRGDRDD